MALITKFSEVACKSWAPRAWAVFIQQSLTVPVQEAEGTLFLIPFFFLQDVMCSNWIVSAEGSDPSLLESLEVFYRFRQVWASTLGKINTAASAHPLPALENREKNWDRFWSRSWVNRALCFSWWLGDCSYRVKKMSVSGIFFQSFSAISLRE